MTSGERDKLVTIQQLTESIPDSRFPKENWTTLGTTWMAKLDLRKTDLRQRERFVAGQTTVALETEWEMPYASNMDPETVDVTKVRRLVYKGRVHDIVGAVQVGRREGIQLTTIAKGRVS